MFLLLLAYFGGVLTILSPCILPVLPFVFARSDQPFRKSGLPLLAGMCITFALVASLATVGGGWAVRANQFGRIAALILFGVFGLTLLFSSLAERLSRPLVQLGNRLSRNSDAGASVLNSFLLGIGTGLLWAPCAGPILGLILTGAALQGASAHTAILLLSYAAGAATSLAIALLAGGRLFAAMKRGLGVEEWIRRALGVAVLAAVTAVAFGLDRGVFWTDSIPRTSQSGSCSARPLTSLAARSPISPELLRGSIRRRFHLRPCAAKWFWWISGLTPASIACVHCLTSRRGTTNTRAADW
jgi:cytochrome c biogenesis protein CcdA